MRIAVDTLGGDNAPGEIVAGAMAAAKIANVELILVGDSSKRPVDLPKGVAFEESGPAIGMDEEPASALRSHPKASVAVAAALVREGEADALFSAGNTGATVASALLQVGRLAGCRRPAIATVFPLPNPILLLDVGATISCRAQDLLNFAILGGVFARRYFGFKSTARVGLVNVGEEPGKGTDLVREAHHLLSESPAVEFVGNVEGQDLDSGRADVIVTDGFTGNVMLKTAEGTSRTSFGMVRSAVEEGGPLQRLAGALLRPQLREVRERVDPENYGGSFLLGVRGPVVIAHGNSRARGVENALRGISGSAEGLVEELELALSLARSGDS